MTNDEFIGKAAGLLALCSDGQRAQLAKMIETYGAPAEGAASDRTRSGTSALASDTSLVGKSIDQAFPGLARLHGRAPDVQADESRYPDANRLRG